MLAIISPAVFLMIGTAQANLLKNGDFEIVDNRVGTVNSIQLDSLNTGSGWDVYSELPDGSSGTSWETASGAGIEVQYDGTVVSAHSGDHYIELDSHPNSESRITNSEMTQEFNVVSEMTYYLSLWYQPRTSKENDNGISIYVKEKDSVASMFDTTVDDVRSSGTDWAQYSYNLGSLSIGTYALGFAATGSSSQFGGFLDTIAVNPVPEPGTMLLFGTGLAALAGYRGRKKR